jgi:hypothetical protein
MRKSKRNEIKNKTKNKTKKRKTRKMKGGSAKGAVVVSNKKIELYLNVMYDKLNKKLNYIINKSDPTAVISGIKISDDNDSLDNTVLKEPSEILLQYGMATLQSAEPILEANVPSPPVKPSKPGIMNRIGSVFKKKSKASAPDGFIPLKNIVNPDSIPDSIPVANPVP